MRNLETPKGEDWGGEERDEKQEEEEEAADEELKEEVAEITVSQLTVFFSRLNVPRSHRGFTSATSSSVVDFHLGSLSSSIKNGILFSHVSGACVTSQGALSSRLSKVSIIQTWLLCPLRWY